MPTPEQREYYARRQAQGDRPRNEGPWFWQGYAAPNYGRIVNDQGVELVAPLTGNAMPAIGQQVLYVPGEPVGQIRLREIVKRAEPIIRRRSDWLISVVYVTDDGGNTVDVWLRESNDSAPTRIATLNKMLAVGLSGTAIAISPDPPVEDTAVFYNRAGGFSIGDSRTTIGGIAGGDPVRDTYVGFSLDVVPGNTQLTDVQLFGPQLGGGRVLSREVYIYRDGEGVVVNESPNFYGPSRIEGDSGIGLDIDLQPKSSDVFPFDPLPYNVSAELTITEVTNLIGLHSLIRNRSSSYFAVGANRRSYTEYNEQNAPISSLWYGRRGEFQEYNSAPARLDGDPYKDRTEPEATLALDDLLSNTRFRNQLTDSTYFDVVINDLQAFLSQGQGLIDVDVNWFVGAQSGTSQVKLKGLPATTRYVLGFAAWHDPATLP